MIKEILYKLNLNEKEIKLFLSLHKSGVQTIKQISEQTLINRTTAYRILESLEEKGLIEWIIDENGRKVKASPPAHLENLLDNQKRKVAEVERELPKMIEQLALIMPSNKLTTGVRYYKGEKGIRQMIWNTLHTKETTRGYAALERRKYIDPKFEDKFEEEWARRGLHDKVIINDDRSEYIEKEMFSLYQKTLDIRKIPKEKFYLTSDIVIYNNIVAMMSLEKDNLVGVEIENAEITKTQKSLFDIVWGIAEPIGKEADF